MVFSVLVLGSGDPVDLGIISDGVVGWVAEDDFVVFVDTVLTDPVAVEHSQSTEGAPDSFFGL